MQILNLTAYFRIHITKANERGKAIPFRRTHEAVLNSEIMRLDRTGHRFLRSCHLLFSAMSIPV